MERGFGSVISPNTFCVIKSQRSQSKQTKPDLFNTSVYGKDGYNSFKQNNNLIEATYGHAGIILVSKSDVSGC